MLYFISENRFLFYFSLKVDRKRLCPDEIGFNSNIVLLKKEKMVVVRTFSEVHGLYRVRVGY